MRRVTGAQFSADGKTVLTASDDKTARLWDVASGQELRALRGHEGGSPARSFPRRQDVLTASWDKTRGCGTWPAARSCARRVA